MRTLFFLSLLAVLHGNPGSAGTLHGTPDTDPGTTPQAVARAQEDPRGGDIIIREMGNLRNKVVADMFCGDGYHTWKLLSAGARVVALDDDPEVIERMQAWKLSQGIDDDRLTVRLTTAGVPGLAPGEVDVALVTREYSTLINPETWIPEMMGGIKSPHLFFLVNYLPGLTDGPPQAQRRDYDTVSDELMLYGVNDIGVGYQQVPGRYILFGASPPDIPEGNHEE